MLQRHVQEKVDINHQTTYYPVTLETGLTAEPRVKENTGNLNQKDGDWKPNGYTVGDREVGSKGHRRTQEHVEVRWREGSMDMVSIQWELCWLVLDVSPYLIFSDRMDAWHSASKQGWCHLQTETWWVHTEQKQTEGTILQCPVYTPKASLCGQGRLQVVMQEQ